MIAENIIPIRGNQQMNNLPEPLTPANSDIRDFGDLPIDVTRVQDSKFAAVVDPASGYYAMMLWFASWHRVPAASLPNDDRQLCHLAGIGRDLSTWKQVKEGALYGWTECSDGNLYHPVLSEKALVAWIEKVHQRIRSGRGNAARWGCEFSEEADLVAKFHEAWEMLKKANPASKLILKGNPLENSKDSARNPTGNPTGSREGILTQSQGKGREGKGREGKVREKKDTPKPPQATSEPEKANAAKAASVSVQQAVDLYHEVLPSLPSVLKVTDARRKAIGARIRDELKTIEDWQAYFVRVSKSDFLTGSAGEFRADLEWLVKPSNMLKVREGKYDPKPKPAPAPSKHNGFAQRDYSKGINPDGSF